MSIVRVPFEKERFPRSGCQRRMQLDIQYGISIDSNDLPGTIDNDLKARNTRKVLKPETFPMLGVAIVT